MSSIEIKERQFEEDIEYSLINYGGYVKGDPSKFNRELALDTDTFLNFIKQSQAKAWQRYERIYGSNSESQIIKRFCKVVHDSDLLTILRHGFKDRGIKFYPVFWKPETTLNKTTINQYKSNVLHCTRQLHYSLKNENSIDIVLFLNGIPIVSMELKCQFTGQNVSNAISQYKFDRASKDTIFKFKERVLVHFAVDMDSVYMTTKLAGPKTVFLPFNQGSNGAGVDGGAGNPPNMTGYASSYLWEDVLSKDRLLELLQKYLHLNKKTKTKPEVMIFPRYHQLDVVTKLLDDVKNSGPGKNYLIQHSAGSGKSNSIAWLAHRLSGLHNRQDKKIFNSIIIVTDRRVLDSQLQDTVYQFDHVSGVVVKIDKNSQQLKVAINEGGGIIITTIQKFPVIYKEVNSSNKNFAIIIDEAHSSQSGEAAKKLKVALADTEDILKEYQEHEAYAEENHKDYEDKIVEKLAAHGRQDNLSFFAFTATPKANTLNTFGIKGEDGKYRPFHVYSMRQAIEEHFILDVLQHYMTYRTYFKILKKIEDDPIYDTARGTGAIARYASLHPHNISQKSAVILDHFINVTSHKIRGRAKAMVVTPSRLHAVRYVQELRRQIKENNYDLEVLVAFSGEVNDAGVTYTEEGMNTYSDGNSVKEKALPEAFSTDEFGMLIVAEKYQTGFDEPLLHTMYVDKKLSGVKAVQTLSRLNRIAPHKHDTMVIDFINSAEDIQEAFEPYYKETDLKEEVDPNVIYTLKDTLDEFKVYTDTEVEAFVDVFFDKNGDDNVREGTNSSAKNNLGVLNSILMPAKDRFSLLDKEKQDIFKTTLGRFLRAYSFVTQVYRMFDIEMEKFFYYAKLLRSSLPKHDFDPVNVDDKISMEYYALKTTFEGEIGLDSDEGDLKPPTGKAGRKEEKKEPLSELVEKINERFGTDFTEIDKIAAQVTNDFVNDKNLNYLANNNDFATYKTIFDKNFKEKLSNRYEENNDFFKKLFSNPEMMEMFARAVCELAYHNSLK